jgi:transposase
MDRRTKSIVRNLETAVQDKDREITILRAQLEAQGVEAQTIVRAGMELRGEEIADLAKYQARITELTKLAEEIAATKSKFAPKARKLLGI